MSNIAKIISGPSHSINAFIMQVFAMPVPDEAEVEGSSVLAKGLQNISTKYNLLYLSPEQKSTIGVEEVEQASSFASRKPHLSPKSYMIVDNLAVMYTEAQTKLLKLIEEPPHYLEIFLLKPEEIRPKFPTLDTIFSRCQVVQLSADETAVASHPASQRELAEIATMLLSSKHDATKGYNLFLDMFDKAKMASERREILEELLQHLASVVKDNNSNYSEEKLAQIEKTTELIDRSNKSMKHNANSKLIIDNLFISLIS
jgi:DNA polymerase III delta prime subunit